MINIVKFVGIVVLGIAALTVVGGPVAGDFLAPRGGVYASFDRGGVWQRSGEVERANINRLNIAAIVHNPKDPRILYMGTLSDAVLKSVDGGATWHRLEDKNKVLDRRANVYSIAVDYTLPDYARKKSDRFYLGVYQNDFGRVLRTEDGGVTFKEVYVSSRPQYGVFAVTLDPREPSVVWAGTAEGLLLRSRDYGETWKLVQEFPGVINAVIINPKNTSQIFVSTFASGIFTSADGGTSWTDETDSLSGFPQASNIEVASLDASTTPPTIYLGSAFGLLKSNNWGIDWQAVSAVFPDEVLPVLSVAVSPRNSREIYVGANRHVYRTLNGGETWQVRQLATNKKVRALWADPRDPNRILAGLGKSGRR